MPISRIVLRLEINSNVELFEKLLKYEAPESSAVILDESHIQLTSNKVVRGISNSPECQDVDFYGRRKFHEISIESYRTEELSEKDIMDLNMITEAIERAEDERTNCSDCIDEEVTVNAALLSNKEIQFVNPLEDNTSSHIENEFDNSVSNVSDDVEISNIGTPETKYISYSSVVSNDSCIDNDDQVKNEKTHGSHHARSPSPVPIYFFSGNPSVEKTEGIMHLYKENQMISLTDNVTRSEMICMLSVPANMTSPDLLQFTAPVEPWIECMKIIRDRSPNLYMVLIKFRTQKYADDYYNTYNNQPYNNIEPECCHLAYVSKVETFKSSEIESQMVNGCTELPTCPVCLERMDESVDGILTILCNHTFHSSCLAQWGDTSCPVCRYVQTPEQDDDHTCFVCDSKENLWICLICGSVGCGRYQGGHARKHYEETQHAFALQLDNSRVWDYSSDNFVHRLITSKGDGKPVEVGYNPTEPVEEEKLDAITLEYTYLLTSQLAAQRHHYEEKITSIEKECLKQVEDEETRTKKSMEEIESLRQNINLLTKDKSIFEKRCILLTQKLNKLTSELQEEKSLNNSLRTNQSEWHQKVVDLDKDNELKKKQITDLQEQMRDIMFYMEAQQKLGTTELATQDEIQESQVVIGPPSGINKKSRKKGR